MSHRVEQARVALETVLATIPSVTVERNRDIPADFIAQSEHLNLLDSDDEELVFGAQNVEFASRVVVNGYVSCATYAELGPALAALEYAVWVKLMANRVLLGSGGDQLTWNVRPGATQRALQTERKKPTMAFEMPVTLCVKTRADDPAIAA